MYITTLEAIDIAIEAINQLPDTERNRQAIIRLTNMKQDKYIHWTKEMVFQQLDKWKEDHGRNPTVTNLAEPNMPKSNAILKLFGMKASAFLNIYYPPENVKLPKTSKYTIRSEQEWIDGFIEQFNSIRPSSCKEYNVKRDKSTPTWLTIARYLNVSTWNELIELTGVDPSCLKNKSQYQTKQYTVDSTSSLYEKLEKLLAK